MRYGRSIMALVSLSAALTACDSDDTAGPVPIDEPLRVTEGSGDLTAALTEFRAVLGEPANGGGDGPQAAGRREIRWDGVPPEQSNTNAFPAGRGIDDLSAGGTHDLVVTDDFLFGEPQLKE